ncbi:MAG: hypothetical protein ACI85F_000725 [Bacteroidia bacterium]|jgi:hypothetical protein
MKKNFLVLGTILISIGLAAFVWQPADNSEVDFVYDLAPRYMRTFTKTELSLVRSIADFENLDFNHPAKMPNIVSCSSVVVSTFDDNYKPILKVKGNTAEFNDAQLELFQSINYSDDILISSEYLIPHNGMIVEGSATPHITVIPETQTEYEGGVNAFLEYVKSHKVHQSTKISKDGLRPGKVRFTVSKKGAISKVILISTSGYDIIDKRMVEMVTEAPGTWKAALDANGLSVEQQLVFSFGITGC